MTNKPTPKRQPRTRQPKKIETKVEQSDKDKDYLGSSEQYKVPENMVPLNDNDRYLQKPRIGKEKAVRGPGIQVTKVGLGGLKVIHQNFIDYHGDIDVRSDTE